MSEGLCANLTVSIHVFSRFTVSFGLSSNVMVSVCLSAKIMVSVCLSANFMVNVSLSGNPAVGVSVSVSVRDTISPFFSSFVFFVFWTVCPDVICPHCKHGVEYKTDDYGCKVCVCKPYGE